MSGYTFTETELITMITSLDAHIQARAEEAAEPLIAEAVARAQERVIEAQAEAGEQKADAQRWKDVNKELGAASRRWSGRSPAGVTSPKGKPGN